MSEDKKPKNSGIPLDIWSGSDATNALHKTINDFNEVTSKQTKSLVCLTWVIAILTAVLTILAVVQVVLLIKSQ